jgi:predicted restriction endonuclease
MVITNFFKKLIPKGGCIPKRNRTGQRLYREKLINKFGKCALEDLHPKLCEAAHILPYSDCKKKKDKYDINNGVLLSSTMHKAFDRNFFTIDEKTCKVKILENKLKEIESDFNLADFGLDKIKDKYIKLLDNEESKKYLAKRNKKLFSS